MTGPGMDDDEYHFHESGSPDPLGPSSEFSGNKGSSEYGKRNAETGEQRLSRKNILFGLGLLAVAYSGFKLVNMMIQAHAVRKAELNIVKVNDVPKPAPAPVKPLVTEDKIPEPAKNDLTMGASMTELSAHNKEINEKIEQFRAINQNSIQQVDTKVVAIQTNIDTLQQQLAKNNEAVQQLLEQSAKQQAVIEQLLRSHEKPKKQAAAPRVKKNNYSVRALVPGRAWLQRKDGSSITVTYGDEIPTLGYVTRIDLGRGLVFMSEGEIISFSPEDR